MLIQEIKKKIKNQKTTNQKAAAAAIATIQTALQRFHHCHLAPQLSGCFANTQDKQTCGLSFRVADLGLSNSLRTQSFELECLSQEKKHQFPVLASHPTGAGCQLPAGKGEVCAQRRKLKKSPELSVSFCQEFLQSIQTFMSLLFIL